MPLTLIVSHNLFLTRDQCYALVEGEKINVVGVNVPVWVHKGRISEPSSEVFAEYFIEVGDDMSIREESHQFHILLPKSRGETSEEGYVSHFVTAKDLLDLPDGAGSLAFRQMHTKSHGSKSINTIHYIEIKRMEDLITTFS